MKGLYANKDFYKIIIILNGFLNDLATKVLLFDGAMGTEIQKYEPSENDYLNNKEGFNDSLNFTRPEWIKTIHKNYIKAGSDCVETNTFGSNKSSWMNTDRGIRPSILMYKE